MNFNNNKTGDTNKIVSDITKILLMSIMLIRLFISYLLELNTKTFEV